MDKIQKPTEDLPDREWVSRFLQDGQARVEAWRRLTASSVPPLRHGVSKYEAEKTYLLMLGVLENMRLTGLALSSRLPP
jgi:hypothetical protein